MSLTDAKVKAAKPGTAAKKLTDGNGLYLNVSRTGAKSWRYDYRLGGKRKTHTIGRYPETTLAEARQALANARALVASGTDPGAHRKSLEQANALAQLNTFEAVARDFIVKRLGAPTHARRWTPGHAAKVTRMLERDVFPSVGAMRVVDVSAAELSPIIEAVASRTKIVAPHQKKARVRARGATSTAVHIRQVCRSIFAHAAARGLARYDFDPTWGLRNLVSKPPAEHCKHLQLSDFPAFWKALEASAASERVKIAIELLALTFVRTAELRKAERIEFDLDGTDGLGPYWRIPPSKMKGKREHRVPLCPRAVELIRRAIVLMDEASPYLFPSRTDPSKPMNPNTVNQALYRMGYAGRLSGHGFRGTASTALHECGYPPHLIETQLAHRGNGDRTAASYNHATYWPERSEMMLSWSKLVSSASNVVPISSAA